MELQRVNGDLGRGQQGNNILHMRIWKGKAADVLCNQTRVTQAKRELRNGHCGGVLWLTGLSGAGKSTIAFELERILFKLGRQVYVLDGDSIRKGLGSDLGFSPRDRTENIRRVGEMAKTFADAGFLCICSLISPYRNDRKLVRSLLPTDRFIEVFVNAPLELCEKRDPKGLYARARANQISDFTGISAPYEPPLEPEIELHTDQLGVIECVAEILDYLQAFEIEHALPLVHPRSSSSAAQNS